MRTAKNSTGSTNAFCAPAARHRVRAIGGTASASSGRPHCCRQRAGSRTAATRPPAIIALAQHSTLKRGAFRPMLSRLVNLLRAGPVDVRYQGAAFRFHHQASATERGALFNPDYNVEELDFLRAHTPAGGIFVDVGANVCTYAMVLARHVGASGKVIAIEPHPVTHARLAFNRTASGFAQVHLVAVAAAA